jgi:hypothetical protein
MYVSVGCRFEELIGEAEDAEGATPLATNQLFFCGSGSVLSLAVTLH